MKPLPGDPVIADPGERFGALIAEFRRETPILVTRPRMPSLDDYNTYLREIWDRRWLTNAGEVHNELETRLAEYLGVKNINLFCNGTIALLVALQSMRINSGEVITTPFTFPATPHVLYWNRIRPVFCDIDPKTYNIDPACLERHISPETKAILAVHVYGMPCDVEAIQRVADTHGLRVIYDAAHVFGVRYKGESILNFGDLSVLSFHATKLFTTIEGGAVVPQSAVDKKRIDYLKNFGIANAEEVIAPGINGKMNELQAAFGLLQLKAVDEEIRGRRAVAERYTEALSAVPGITPPHKNPDVEWNAAYYPILVDSEAYGLNRDELYGVLKTCNIHPRKYFYPLCSHFSCYSAYPSAAPSNLPVAERVAMQVLCLPIYGEMTAAEQDTVIEIIRRAREAQ